MANDSEKTTFVRADFTLRCLICGTSREEKTRSFRKLGSESSVDLEKELTDWVKNYIGLIIRQASCCKSCFRRLRQVDERARYLRDSCKRTVKAATVFAVTAEPLKDGEDFLTGPTGLLDFGVIKMVAASFGRMTSPAPIIVQPSTRAPVVQAEQHLRMKSVSAKEAHLTVPYPVGLEKNKTAEPHGSTSTVSGTSSEDFCQAVGTRVSANREPTVVMKCPEAQVTDKPMEGECALVKQLEQQNDRRWQFLPSDKNRCKNTESKLNVPGKKKVELETESSHLSTVKQTKSTVPVVRSKRRIKKRKRHYKDPSMPTVYCCRLCNVEFQKYNAYLEHNQTHVLLYSDLVHNQELSCTDNRIHPLPSDPLMCSICGRMFATTRQRKDHFLRMHPGPDELYKCKLCDNKIASKKSMQSHLLGHAMYLCNKYQCKFCEKKYSSRASLSCHMKKHTSSKPRCPHCAKTFATRGSLTYHVDVMHMGKDVKKHMCDICGKLFPRQSELEAHKVIHSEARNHLCEICGKTFKKLQNLGFHMKIHVKRTSSDKVKSHSCGVCSKKFVRLTALADHVTVVHEKECILCGAAISSKKMLLKHRRLCKRERKTRNSSGGYLSTSRNTSDTACESMATRIETDRSNSCLENTEKTSGTTDIEAESTSTSDSGESRDAVYSTKDTSNIINTDRPQNITDINQTGIDLLFKKIS